MDGRREIEVKFRVDSFAEVRARLVALNAELVGRSHETNLCFDDDAESLRAEGKLLRLRQDDRVRLTFKAKLEGIGLTSELFKARREIETEVSDFAASRQILEALGYGVSVAYEKDRETWRLGRATICLDKLDFGQYVEFEWLSDGSWGEQADEPAELAVIVARLGFDLSRGISASYIQLQRDHELARG